LRIAVIFRQLFGVFEGLKEKLADEMQGVTGESHTWILASVKSSTLMNQHSKPGGTGAGSPMTYISSLLTCVVFQAEIARTFWTRAQRLQNRKVRSCSKAVARTLWRPPALPKALEFSGFMEVYCDDIC
jgi:hypothetical protein